MKGVVGVGCCNGVDIPLTQYAQRRTVAFGRGVLALELIPFGVNCGAFVCFRHRLLWARLGASLRRSTRTLWRPTYPDKEEFEPPPSLASDF